MAMTENKEALRSAADTVATAAVKKSQRLHRRRRRLRDDRGDRLGDRSELVC